MLLLFGHTVLCAKFMLMNTTSGIMKIKVMLAVSDHR